MESGSRYDVFLDNVISALPKKDRPKLSSSMIYRIKGDENTIWEFQKEKDECL